MDELETTSHDMKVHRHEDGCIEVQIDGKTSMCPEGHIECAFKRSWDWVEHGKTHGPTECFGYDHEEKENEQMFGDVYKRQKI